VERREKVELSEHLESQELLDLLVLQVPLVQQEGPVLVV